MTPKQMSLSMQQDAGFERHRKATRRDVFLAVMDQVVPWAELCAVIEPYYLKEPVGGGRRPVGLERMLRIHFLQQCFRCSLTAATIVNRHLHDKGLKLSQGTIVDATILGAPSSTKNRDKARDPEMHQTKKGNQWYFGMKAHIGVDEATGLVHSVVTTAANVGDVTQVGDLLHGKEKAVFGDAGYTGAEKHAPAKRRRKWHIAAKRSKVKAIEDGTLRALTEQIEHIKASIRAVVEHPFRVIKRQFGHVKARYRGLAKNGAQVLTLFALGNLWMVRQHLLATTG